jgi:hypothetical protein
MAIKIDSSLYHTFIFERAEDNLGNISRGGKSEKRKENTTLIKVLIFRIIKESLVGRSSVIRSPSWFSPFSVILDPDGSTDVDRIQCGFTTFVLG